MMQPTRPTRTITAAVAHAGGEAALAKAEALGVWVNAGVCDPGGALFQGGLPVVVVGETAGGIGVFGHQGVSILRPLALTGGRDVLICRFDSWAHAQDREDSDVRNVWVAKRDGLVKGEAERKQVTGLEVWFDLPEVPAAAHAPRWKMSLALIAAVFALVYPLQLIIRPLVPTWPHWVKTLTIAGIQTLLMTYLAMPRVTARLKPWLFRSAHPPQPATAAHLAKRPAGRPDRARRGRHRRDPHRPATPGNAADRTILSGRLDLPSVST